MEEPALRWQSTDSSSQGGVPGTQRSGERPERGGGTVEPFPVFRPPRFYTRNPDIDDKSRFKGVWSAADILRTQSLSPRETNAPTTGR